METFKVRGIELALIDTEPQTVTNPFSGESCVLEPEAVAMYDYIKGCEICGTDFSDVMEEFIKRYPEEYMILLD